MGLFDFNDGTFFDFGEIFKGLEDIIPMNLIIAIIIILIGAVIWRNDKSGYALTAYFIMMGILGSVAIAPPMGMFFYLLTAIGIGMVFYKLYENRSRY